jgi:hypothetical protein
MRMNTHVPKASADVARQAAYRRLAIVMLELDVATLADELRSARLETERADETDLPAAA